MFNMLTALPTGQFFCLPSMPPDGATTVPVPRHKPEALESRQGESSPAVYMLRFSRWCDVTRIMALCFSFLVLAYKVKVKLDDTVSTLINNC
jgi:hypothetical protein